MVIVPPYSGVPHLVFHQLAVVVEVVSDVVVSTGFVADDCFEEDTGVDEVVVWVLQDITSEERTSTMVNNKRVDLFISILHIIFCQCSL